jgi:hypothetical protein
VNHAEKNRRPAGRRFFAAILRRKERPQKQGQNFYYFSFNFYFSLKESRRARPFPPQNDIINF